MSLCVTKDLQPQLRLNRLLKACMYVSCASQSFAKWPESDPSTQEFLTEIFVSMYIQTAKPIEDEQTHPYRQTDIKILAKMLVLLLL